MFEAAELGKKLSKKQFAAQLPALRRELLEAQFALQKSKLSVLVIVSGVDGAGKGEVVQRLNEWLDPRGLDTHAFWQPSDEEEERPPYWRFWRTLPARGRIGIFFGSWYTRPIVQRAYREIKTVAMDSQLQRIAFFENMLVEDGAIIVKLWFHLSKKAQRRRLEELEASPETHWRVLPTDWKHHKLYDRFIEISERALRQTDTAKAPWHLIEAVDRRYRELTAAAVILEAIRQRLPSATSVPAAAKATPKPARLKEPAHILDKVNLNQALSDEAYAEQLAQYQGTLSRLAWKASKQKVSTVALFEGWDAAGKGSAIRRVTQAIDPRLYQVIPIAAPTDEERAHHYLWRFWRHLPRSGRLTIFDRSWYGRVLVERVEGFARPDEWRRAFLEINDFEEQLAKHGIVLAKFWIHISKEEQLRRFKERERIVYKQHKITGEDWRNRKQWDPYCAAINDMVAHTSTATAPWTLVAGNDKKFARIQILKTLCARLDAVL